MVWGHSDLVTSGFRQWIQPDSVPIESEEERDAREADEMALSMLSGIMRARDVDMYS